ncbi:MAG: YIP1 family protein [Planctomycetes bacterium]|nr:YIP1 family protein [Planctomycetota bacterium]
MSIEFTCARCGKTLRVADTLAGKVARCPACTSVVQVPGGSAGAGSPGSGVPPVPSSPPEAPPPGPVPPPPPPPQRPRRIAPPDVAEHEAAGPEEAAPAEPSTSSCPWEERARYPGGAWAALVATWKAACLDPTTFFSRLPSRGPDWDPVLYALACALPGILVQMVWQVLLAGFRGGRPIAAPQVLCGGFLLAPIWLTLGFVVAAAILHGSVLLVGGSKEGFTVTFRVVAYSMGPHVLHAIPGLGSLASGIWLSVLLVIGLRERHRISTGRAIAVVTIPGLACGCALTVALFAFLSLIFAAWH